MYIFNLAQRFKQVLEKYADRTALHFPDDGAWCYTDLDAASDRIALFLKMRDIGKGDVVAVSGDKTFFTFAVLIACLKSGATYTVFDPFSPVERLYKILDVCQPGLVFCSVEHAVLFKQCLDKGVELVSGQMKAMPDSGQKFPLLHFPSSTPAYIMFTSGSTGTPKGAVITHGNLLNFIDWGKDAFGIDENEVISNVNPLYFDNSVFDLYCALFNGATLVPFDRSWVTNAAKLVRGVERMHCTQWFSVPTMLVFLQTMKAIKSDSFKELKRIIFGGEGYPLPRLKKLYDLMGDRIDFFNVYGPTECTCICSQYKIEPSDFDEPEGFPPLGHIIPNFSWILLDEDGGATAPEMVGELCLSGPNVGSGYYNDPDNTARHFCLNPLNNAFPERIYKTGDLVRYDAVADKIYILGRKDNQIKHLGYRIELEEIETALCRLDYVTQAMVVHGTFRGLSRLVAVVCGDERMSENGLRRELKKLLPDYMVPNEFHPVRDLPTNANGKVDRRRVSEMYLNEKRNAS